MTGGGALLRLHLRRDRWMLLWWVAGIAVFYWSQAWGTEASYPTQGELDEAAAAMQGNAAFIAMAGPARALDTIGGQTAWQAGAFGMILTGLMAMFLIGRHTRAEEESGRDELIRASAIGRRTPLLAAGLVAVLACVAAGAVVAATLSTMLPWKGSVVLGVGAAGAGLFFGALTLVAAQITSSTRAVYGAVGIALGGSYVLRAIGDVAGNGLSWASPLGWGQAMRAFSGERWWPAALLVGSAAALGVVAFALLGRRDIGSGLRAARPGPSSASRSLGAGGWGLAWRLQRPGVLGWLGALALVGLAMGTIGDDVEGLVGDEGLARDLLVAGGSGAFTDQLYGTVALMVGLGAAGPAIAAALHARAEEDAGRAELVLSTALPRGRWALGHLAIAMAAGVAGALIGGFGMGLGYLLVTGDASQIPRFTGAVGIYALPVLVLLGVTWTLYGLGRRWAPLGWAALGFCVFAMIVGRTLQLPGWLLDVSPYQHIPLLPAEPFAWTPVVVLAAIAAVLLGTGAAALRHRDLA